MASVPRYHQARVPRFPDQRPRKKSKPPMSIRQYFVLCLILGLALLGFNSLLEYFGFPSNLLLFLLGFYLTFFALIVGLAYGLMGVMVRREVDRRFHQRKEKLQMARQTSKENEQRKQNAED